MGRGTLRWCPGAVALATALVTAAAGCGASGRAGHDGAPTGTATPRLASGPSGRPRAAVYGGPAPLLVYFKRVIGVDPLATELVVDSNGSAAATITLGGVGGQKRHDFTMPASALRGLRALMAHTRLTDTACCNDPGYYLYWISAGGHTWRLEARRVPPRARRLIDALNAITDAHTGY